MKFNINQYLIDDIENKDHPSDFELIEDGAVLILRLPYIKDDKVEVYSYPFFIKDKVYIYNRDKKDFELLGGFEDLHKYLDVRVDKILAKISKFHSTIANIEDEMYEGKIDKKFVNEWLMLKKELAIIERLMAHSMIAVERFIKHFKAHLDEFAYKDLSEHIERAFRFSKSAIEKLDYLYNFYEAKMNEKMNNVMFVLTIISAIFLPLTLVTGFFGMNTGGLPWVNDNIGTLKASIMGIVLEIPFVILIYKMIRR